jgi:hypothetical protein
MVRMSGIIGKDGKRESLFVDAANRSKGIGTVIVSQGLPDGDHRAGKGTGIRW